MLHLEAIGWIEKEAPACGPLDALVRPLAAAPCSSDVHTVWEGAMGDRHNLILGHEAVGEVLETGALVRDFKPGDRVLVPAITPDWNSLEAQGGYAMHSGGMLAGWKFSNFKDGVFAEVFHVNDADGNLAHLPKGMDLAAAVMLSDMVPTGLHGAELADVQYGDAVLVVGIGPVGLMSVAGAALRGAGAIYAVGSAPLCQEGRQRLRPRKSSTTATARWRNRSWPSPRAAAWTKPSWPGAMWTPLPTCSKFSNRADASATSTTSAPAKPCGCRVWNGAAVWAINC